MSTRFPIFKTQRKFINDPYMLTTLVDDLFNFDEYPKEKSYNSPKANIYKTENGYSVEMAVPGYSRDEFEMVVDQNKLTISLNTTDGDEHDQKIIHQEYSYKSFKRSFLLPENTNFETIDARYESGILYVEVPVNDMGRKKRKITVS